MWMVSDVHGLTMALARPGILDSRSRGSRLLIIDDDEELLAINFGVKVGFHQ